MTDVKRFLLSALVVLLAFSCLLGVVANAALQAMK